MHILSYISAVLVIFLEIFYPFSIISGVVLCLTATIHVIWQVLSCAAGDDVPEQIAYHCREWPGLLAGDIVFVVAFGLGIVAILEPSSELTVAGAAALVVGNGFYTYKDCTEKPDVRPELRHHLVEV